MPLPTLSVPTFEVDLPSTGKKIKYRPFLVKEEKLLLLAMEGDNDKEVEAAVKDILKACILTRGIKVENLASFDLEYLFLRIRAVSAGEEIRMKVTCQDDNTTEVDVAINIDDIKVQKPEGHSNKIMLEEEIGMIMKYPGIDQFINITLLNKDLTSTTDVFELVAKCVDQIFQGEEVWETSDMKLEEIITFLEGMTQQQFEKIQDFFETMPVLRHQIEVKNPNTGKVSVYQLEGLQSFFISMFYNTLENYYRTNFSLMQHHKYSLTEIENMMPWERTVYISLLNQWIKEQEEAKKAAQR